MRAARRRHQQSPEGRADHRDHQRALRERRRQVMDHSSEVPSAVDMLGSVDPAVFHEPDEKETKGELLFFWSPSRPRCRFCGRASVYLDVG
jgi:hypothetical protein